MHQSLTVLRNEPESARFKRPAADDACNTIGSESSEQLAPALKQRVNGEIRFDNGTRARCSTDVSNYCQAPIGVVVPRHIDDVIYTIKLCRQFGAPILSRGGGTSLAGQCCNVAVVMDFSKSMRAVKKINEQNKHATIEPGGLLADLRNTAIKQAELNFGPDPETNDHCTFGDMISNNSCGVHSLMCANEGHGLRVSDNLHEIDVIAYDGVRMRAGRTGDEELERIIASGSEQGKLYAKLKARRDQCANVIRHDYPKLGRRVSGYNLSELLPENGFHVARALGGSKSRLVSNLEATVQLVAHSDVGAAENYAHPFFRFVASKIRCSRQRDRGNGAGRRVCYGSAHCKPAAIKD